MKLSQLGEFGLIDLIARHAKKRAGTVVGTGDDAAVLEVPGSRFQVPDKPKASRSKSKKYLLATTDTLVEGVDFKRKGLEFFRLGQKALRANISDIAAMGGVPTHALITIGLPKTTEVSAVRELYRGINSLAGKEKIDIVGGDTTASAMIFISITLLGEVEKENLLLRSTARAGDLICVTGKFGGPAAVAFDGRKWKAESRTQEARIIAKSHVATAMIDSSDGLVRSVLEICRASKAGARIWPERVPIAKGATLDQALYGGEEYELVFTATEDKIRTFNKVKFTVVGEMVARAGGVKLIDGHGKIKALKSSGFEHFKHDK